MSDESEASKTERVVERDARATIENLLRGRVGRETKKDLGDALRRAEVDAATGAAIVGGMGHDGTKLLWESQRG